MTSFLWPASRLERSRLSTIIAENHYTASVPSGKSHYFSYGDAVVVFSIPANMNIASWLLGWPGNVWELSRLWAPDGHAENLLTQAISIAAKSLRVVEPTIDAVISYADPSAGHQGGVYRAASWTPCGRSEETRSYRNPDGQLIPRRKFHSGRSFLTKAEIERQGFVEERTDGKLRFARGFTRKARKAIRRRVILAAHTVAAMRSPASLEGVQAVWSQGL